MLTQDTIHGMVTRLVEQFHPRMILLFGSWARGQADAGSDVDLMVVVDHTSDRRGLRIAMRRALAGMGVPKDIVVVTADEFQSKRDVPGSIIYPATHEGRVLYAA